jgi:hypothetical protein
MWSCWMQFRTNFNSIYIVDIFLFLTFGILSEVNVCEMDLFSYSVHLWRLNENLPRSRDTIFYCQTFNWAAVSLLDLIFRTITELFSFPPPFILSQKWNLSESVVSYFVYSMSLGIEKFLYTYIIRNRIFLSHFWIFAWF